MAVLTEERSRVSSDVATRIAAAGITGEPRPKERKLPSPLAWLARAGELVLGLVLTLVGLLVRVMLAVALVAVPVVGIVLVVLLYGLLIEGAGLLH